ncbi:MAG: 3-deoxy-D-manno-octulosonic acid transferase [Candidatus Aminicenantales bacterium]
MYLLYSLLLALSSIFLFPCYFFKKKIIRGESLNVKARLGWGLKPLRKGDNSFWIHAVSVGEVLSLQKLVAELKRRHSSWLINFSTLTPTGMKMAEEKLSGVDNFFYLPFDFAFALRKAYRLFSPKLLILAESEFWPNLLKIAKERKVNVLLVNGRISERSFRRYKALRFLAKKILNNVDLFLVQTEKDKERLEKIGVDSRKIRFAGNLKAEIELPIFSDKEVKRLKEELNIGAEEKVIIAGSTRKREEEELLRALAETKKLRRDLKLILAPRHLDRVDEVEKMSRNLGFRVERKTKLGSPQDWDVLILDTLGELARSYALSDMVFVGGSLVPWGGHNLLEPAFYAKPVFFGPYMKNFAFFAERFLASDAARIVNNWKDLALAFQDIGSKQQQEMGKRAKSTLNSLQGATEKTIGVIEKFMER